VTFDRSMLRIVAISGEPADDQEQLARWAEAAVRGGATSVQLRGKTVPSGRLLDAARLLVARLTVPVIVNDRADIAIIAGAAGVHLGADDLPIEAVRSFAPTGFIIGASVGDDEELLRARGADYVGVGPVYGTASKCDAGSAIGPAEMARLIRASGCPGVGIGGITAGNAAEIMAAGAEGIAVLSALATAPERSAKALASAIGI
jgi:thiamine-phosphate pyrophosphorylase